MKPFDDYPGVGYTILKPMSRTNTRRGNGLWLMGNAGQDRRAYCCSAWITSSSRRNASGCVFTLFGITPFPASSWPAPAATRSTTGTKSYGSGQGLRMHGRRMDLPPCGTGCLGCLRRGGHVFSNGIGMQFGSSSRRFRGYRAFHGLGGLIDGEGGLFVCAVGGRRSVARAPAWSVEFRGSGKIPENSVDNLRPAGYYGFHSRSQSGSVGHLNNWIVKGNRQTLRV